MAANITFKQIQDKNFFLNQHLKNWEVTFYHLKVTQVLYKYFPEKLKTVKVEDGESSYGQVDKVL
jgi:hypothetical protein